MGGDLKRALETQQNIIANGGADAAHLHELAEEELPPVACRGGGGRG
jgi:hypothetical protein